MKNLSALFGILFLLILFNSCEKKNDDLTKISTGIFLYQPNSDTCSNCETSYIIFYDSLTDTLPVILDCRVPSAYRVKEGVEVTVEWSLSSQIMPQFYIFPSKHCGVKKIPLVTLIKFN